MSGLLKRKWSNKMATSKKVSKKASSKKVSKKTAKKTASKKVTKKKGTVKKQTKMAIAVPTVERMFFEQGKERKDILPVLMEKLKCSKPMASTYFYLIRDQIIEDESN